MISSVVLADQQYKTHKVSRGETIESIARDYGVPVSAIYKLNPDAKKGISSSTRLIIPPKEVVQEEPNVTFKNHRVKSKETLYSLSKEYNVSIDDIKRYNKFLYAEPLKKGDKLRIPTRPVLSETTPAITQPQTASEKEKTKEHIVLPKETKYGIAREYGITIQELEEMNPWMDSLQPGMMLKIEVRDAENTVVGNSDNEKYRTYEVQPQETMYSLIREFKMTRDSLVALNPELRDGLKAGMVLRLPKKENLQPSYYSTSEDLEQQINNRNAKNLVLMLPFNLDKLETDSLSNAQERIKKDQVLQISLDFYSGVLLAMDSAKRRGIPVNLQVLDTRQSPSHVRNIISTTNFSNVDAVIGPLLQETAETAAMQLHSSGIPVVSPLSTKEVRDMENFVQTRPSKEMMENTLISYLSENSSGRNIVIIADKDFSRIKNKLVASLSNAKVVNPTSGTVSQNELLAAMEKGRENWVVVESNNIGLLSSLASRLNSLRSSYSISLFTTDRNKSFDSENISNRHLGNLNFHFPSVDKEYDALRNRDFVTAYRNIYGLDPNQYAVRGFDITYDIILRLAAFNSLYRSFEVFDGTTEYAENKFDYEKRQDGGYYNNAMYIIKYDSNLKRNVVK